MYYVYVGLLWSDNLIQAEELRKALCAKDIPAKVYVGMRYWHPFTEEAIEQVKQNDDSSWLSNLISVYRIL